MSRNNAEADLRYMESAARDFVDNLRSVGAHLRALQGEVVGLRCRLQAVEAALRTWCSARDTVRKSALVQIRGKDRASVQMLEAEEAAARALAALCPKALPVDGQKGGEEASR